MVVASQTGYTREFAANQLNSMQLSKGRAEQKFRLKQDGLELRPKTSGTALLSPRLGKGL